MFVNSLPIRINLNNINNNDNNNNNNNNNNISFIDYCTHIREIGINHLIHSRIPSNIINSLIIGNNSQSANTVLFRLCLIWTQDLYNDDSNNNSNNNNNNNNNNLMLYELNDPYAESGVESKFDIQLTPFVDFKTNSIIATFDYNKLHFKYDTINNLANRFNNLINILFNNTNNINNNYYNNININTISLLSNDELSIIKSINDNSVKDFGIAKSIPYMFQESVNKYPNNIACRLDGISLTYKQLHNKVVQLSQLLINKYNVKSGSYIAQCVDRSLDMLIGILSIMSIGCIYVPLNPNDPIDRLAFLINVICCCCINSNSFK